MFTLLSYCAPLSLPPSLPPSQGADSCVEMWRVRSEEEKEKLRKKRARKLQKRLKRTGDEEGQAGNEEITLSVLDELPAVLAHTFKTKLR